MNSVLILSDKDGPWDVYAGKTMKHRKLPEGTTVTRYVPASELARIRRDVKELRSDMRDAMSELPPGERLHVSAIIQLLQLRVRNLTAEKRRLLKAVEWAVNDKGHRYHLVSDLQFELARNCGYVIGRKKWVKKSVGPVGPVGPVGRSGTPLVRNGRIVRLPKKRTCGNCAKPTCCHRPENIPCEYWKTRRG